MCRCGKATPANWLAGLDRGLLVVNKVSDISSLAVDIPSNGSVVDTVVVVFELRIGSIE